MKPSSKFERMKLKPSDRMKAKPMVAPMSPGGGAGQALSSQSMGMKKAMKPMDPRVAARKKAMQKMGNRYGK
jgi:hypothetical protein